MRSALSPRDSYQRFPSISNRISSSRNNNTNLFQCTQTKAIACIIIAWLILTIITYQKIFNVDTKRESRKKGAIPAHHTDALGLYKHLSDKIKEKEETLKKMGIDITDLHLIDKLNKLKDDTSQIVDDPLKQFLSKKKESTTKPPTTTTTTTTTKPPTPAPTTTTTKAPTKKPTPKPSSVLLKYYG